MTPFDVRNAEWFWGGIFQAENNASNEAINKALYPLAVISGGGWNTEPSDDLAFLLL